MRYIKLMVCTGILLLLAGVASAQEDYINILAGGGPNDVTATLAPVYLPTNIALDKDGNVYFSTGYGNYYRIWEITKSTGKLTVVAGSYSYGYDGDGGLAVNALLDTPLGIAVDYNLNVFFADFYNCIVRKVTASTGIITTVAGTPTVCKNGTGATIGNGGKATSAYLYYPQGVALDKNGNLFIADYVNEQIRMVSCATVTSTGATCAPNSGQTTGDIYTVAGDGTAGYNSDSQAATSAELYAPYGVATDSAGNLYIADQDNNRVRRVACGTGISSCTVPTGETKGDIYTVAGDGTAGYAGDGAAAISAEVNYPTTVSVDNEGNLFIADYSNFRIREVSCVTKTSTGGTCTASTDQTAGYIYTVVGTGTPGYNDDSQAATGAEIEYAVGVAVDSAGDLFIADQDNYRIREVPCDVNTLTCTPPSGDTKQFIYTIAGTGELTFSGTADNNLPATGAVLNDPTGVASDSAGNIYIADTNNCVIREVSGTPAEISVFAGTLGTGGCTYGGDGGSATSASLYYPYRVVVDSKDNVFIADYYSCLIRKVSGGTITTVVGKSPTLACGYEGDGGPATAAELAYPNGIALDKSGDLYISDYQNQVIRVVSCLTVNSAGGTCTPKAGETAGYIYTFAGDNAKGFGFSGDGGPATSAQLYSPYDVAVDALGNVYIADYSNYRVRKVNTSGIISTFAGNGATGYEVDGVLATDTSVYGPAGLAVDGAGDVLIADQNNERLRLVDGEGIIHTIAGDGTPGFGGTNILATAAELYTPRGVNVDSSGNIYEADYQNDLVRKINAPITLNSSVPSITFDTQTINTTSDAVALTLSANGTAAITSITPSAGFLEVDDCPTALSSGTTCLVNVRFSPTTDGVLNGTLTVKYNGFLTSSLVVPLQGEGSGLSISPVSLGFATQLVTAAAVTKTVTVTGKTTYSSPSATLDGSAAFTIASNTCTGAITTSCVIGIAFEPTSATLGALKNTLIIHDNDPTNPQLVALTGTGTEVTLTPTTLAFGTVASGSKALSVTVKNVGTTTLSFSKAPTITGTGSANFVVLPYSATGPQGTCLNGTVTLVQNASCTYTVQFTFAGGTTAFTTDLNIFDNGGGTQTVVMTATD
ncbi:MAG: choice-of-anchor D domain-containing protein [Candidatus Sulfotelmatobacter sp.]